MTPKYLVFSFSAFLLIAVFPGISYSELPDAPIILDAGPGGCAPTDEVCGDGIDQDCNGSDLACSGSDADRDGFAGSADCNDNNRKIYPGISVPCSASCGQGTQTCQQNGSFTACSCTPLCEATGGGKCYYISALTGSDSNPGTFNSPWKTVRNIISYSSVDVPAPPTRVRLEAGDVVYFQSGRYGSTVTAHDQILVLYFRGESGTAQAPITIKAYPGAHPVIAPTTQALGFWLLDNNYFLIEGFEVTGAYGKAIYISGGGNNEIRNNWLHDTDGLDNNNIAGVGISTTNGLNFHHNLVHDNYDRENADTGGNKTQNSRNIVLFKGGNTRIHHNVIFQSQDPEAQKTGGCITYKHSADVPGAIFEVDHNILSNCAFTAIGSGSYGNRIHHNLIINSYPIQLADFGGPTFNQDTIIENNTIVSGPGFLFAPTETYGPIGETTFRKNIIIDNAPSYHQERGIVTMGTYGTDELYQTVVTPSKLHFDNNCYYNPGPSARWAIFAANGGSRGVLGGLWSLSEWQSKGFDGASVVVDPQLDSSATPLNSACQNYGWLAP